MRLTILSIATAPRLLAASLLLGTAGPAWGQGGDLPGVAADTAIVRAYVDSLASLGQRLDSLPGANGAGDGPGNACRLFHVLAPLAYYDSAVARLFTLGGRDDPRGDADEAIDRALLAMCIRHPELVANREEDIRRAGALHEEIRVPVGNRVRFTDEEAREPDEDIGEQVEIKVRRPNFWTVTGEYDLQFYQNYISGNWYKGGESNYSMVGSVVMQANYDNKRKLTFENKLELKLGFQASRGDTLHSLTTSEDLIRYTGKLGLQATKNWYYTFQAIAYTQFMRGYKSNDPEVYSDFMSPFNVNASLGMSYAVKAFGERLSGSVNLAPLAVNLKYVGMLELGPSFGLDEGKRTLVDFGSELTCDLAWKFSDLLKWQTRLYAYTTYSRFELEWENTFTLQFNRYIAANLFLYPRFDDSASRDGHHGYWQFKEYTSLGFSYSF